MYKDKKTPMKRVRSIGRQSFLESHAAGQAERGIDRTVKDGNRAGLAAKHPLPNVARLFTGVRNLRDLVKGLFILTEPEFERNLLVFPANPKLQQIAGLLLLKPVLHTPGHLATIPVEDDIPGAQASLDRRAFGIDRTHDERTARIVLREEAKRRSPAFHGSQSQTCQRQDLLIGEGVHARHIFPEKFVERAAADGLRA